MASSILGRVSQLLRANVNDLMDRAEDPEKMLDQLIRDFTNNIQEAEEAVAVTVGNLRLMEEDHKEAVESAKEWGDKARAASKKAEEMRAESNTDGATKFDELARVALRRQISFEEQVSTFGTQIEFASSLKLARADAVIILLPADAPGVDPELIEAFGDLPVHVARLMPAAPPPKGPILGFAGIAKPWKVERALDTAGAELVDFAPFPDHAPFRETDLAFLADRAHRFGARLVTTEKDWFRLPPEWRAQVLSWPVKATFEDEAGFQRLLLSALSQRETA